MKKITTSLLLAAHLLGLVPLPANAAYPTQNHPRYNGDPGAITWPASRVSRSKRVAFIRPSRSWTAYGAPQVQAACLYNGVFQVEDMLREQGAEIHTFHTSEFEAANGSRLFREMGDYYALVVILNPIMDVASQRTYINPDSTNAQLFVVGGTRSNGASTWTLDTASTRGSVDRSGALLYAISSDGSSTGKFSGLVPWTSSGLSSDTLWGTQLATGYRCSDATMASLHTGVSSVVRVLHPVVAGNPGVAWASVATIAADTNTAKMPGAVDGFPKLAAGTPDSVAREYEYLGPVWKVKYATGDDVWFFKFSGTGGNVGLLYACMARFVDVPPIKWALDFDDVTDLNDGTNYPRWRQSAAESSMAALRRYGVVPSNAINPGNAPGYITGSDPMAEVQPYAAGSDSTKPWIDPRPGVSTDPHVYIKSLNWIHHAHDSTNSSITSNLVGGYGGYPPTNGAIAFGNGQTGRRYASRWNPGANEAKYFGAAGNFGIVQRLAYSDSVRKAVSPGSHIPPYLTFPANQMLPINWTTRPACATYTPTHLFQSEEASCGVDSVLWAYDYGLNKQQTTGKGEIWLRGGWVNKTRNEWRGADRDSFAASSLALYARERWTARVGSRLVQATILNSFNQGIGNRSAYIAQAGPRSAYLLGLTNATPRAEMNNTLFSESTYNYDVNSYLGGGTGQSGGRDFPARQSTRILYLHPGQQTTAVGARNNESADLHVEIFLRGIHSNIRVMDAVAGRRVTVCVPAWQVYAKK